MRYGSQLQLTLSLDINSKHKLLGTHYPLMDSDSMHKRIINFCTITSHKGEEIDWEGTIAVFEAVGSEFQSVYNYYRQC